MSTEEFAAPKFAKMFAKKSSGVRSSSGQSSQAGGIISAVGKATSSKLLMVVGIIATILTIILVPTGLSVTFGGSYASGISTLAAGLLTGWLAYTMFTKM